VVRRPWSIVHHQSEAHVNTGFDNLWAILPLRSLRDGKRRLRGILSPADRATLVQRLFERAYRAALESNCCQGIIVVSPDPDVLAWIDRFQVVPAQQLDTGLNQGLERARRVALAAGATSVLVVLPDLPAITSESIRALTRRGGVGRVVIAADRHGRGTNALLLNPADALPFAFGDDSRRQHVDLAIARGLIPDVAQIAGMILDVDTAEDLQLAGALLDQHGCAGAHAGG